MKAILITAFFMGFITVNAASAAQQINHADEREKIGVISASNAYTLDDLSDELSHKADDKGAIYYKIISTAGNNLLHGDAEIYR